MDTKSGQIAQQEIEVIANLAFANSSAALAQLERYTADLKRLVKDREQALKDIQQAHLNALTLLCRAAEFRDDETGVHMDRVGLLSQLLTQLMGRSEEEAYMIRVAAPMHDIGKIAIPDLVLKKPGSFSPDERLIMNRHTVFGAQILGQSDIPIFRMAAEIALTHHECWDGSGYPRQLRESSIPWTGKVVTLIDFFDALTMDRVYRKAFSDEKALEMLEEQSGRKFDPELVRIFMHHVDQFIRMRNEVNAAAVDYDAVLQPNPNDLAAHLGI